ncbi:AsnC family transcriptional regulator [Rhizobium sp. LjRoot30]|uniref:Lrp/AsnC family transcriptional regulator n=1 Tax=Rhizobium sp. LjRoot30 TaxID=3342320 RepID=UPI003ECED991
MITHSNKIDDLDRNIIRELQIDGRRSLREVARNIGMAEATVRLRLKRLQDEGILQIVAFADPTKLGPSHMALLFFSVDPGCHNDVVQRLSEWTEVSYLSTTLGDTDICAQVVCADQVALWALRQKIAAMQGVGTVKILNEVDVHKIRFALPVEIVEEI